MLIIFGIPSVKKKFKHYVCQILLFLAACQSQIDIECPLFAEYHYSASKFDLYVCIQLFTHQTIKIFDSINVLIRSNYINKYIFKF